MRWQDVANEFTRDPAEIYLNAGTFSALPRRVMDAMIERVRFEELNPSRHISFRWRKADWEHVHCLVGEYVGAPPESIVLHNNVTEALNQALFGYRWPASGEVLVSNREYGAIVNAVREAAVRRGLSVRVFDVPEAAAGPRACVDALLAALTPRTVGVLLSHVCCVTGQVMPVTPIAVELRKRGVTFFVDGAHGPGLIDLSLNAGSIDFYAGNLHKWFMGPKGTAFLYVAERCRKKMDPLIVGWGGVPGDSSAEDVADATHEFNPGEFRDVFQLQGLRSRAPMIALEETLRFRRSVGEAAIQQRIEALGARLRSAIGPPCLSPGDGLSAGLVAFVLPDTIDANALQESLFERHRITIAAFQDYAGRNVLRVSPHIWSLESHIDKLAQVLPGEIERLCAPRPTHAAD